MIKKIIFDIGEVLLGYKWFKILEMSGLSSEEGARVGKEIFDDPIWYNLDAGNVMLTEAKEQYRIKYPKDADNIDFFLNHPQDMPIARPEIWAYLPKLKEKGYMLYVLSNYGKELFEMHTTEAGFWPLIDGAVISYEVHVCKPDKEIYECLINKYNLEKSDCIFFDDREENVKGAINCGINAVQIKSEDMLKEQLDKLLEE